MARQKGKRRTFEKYGRGWRRLRDEGISLRAIARKYGTSEITVMRYTNPNGLLQRIKWLITG